MAALTASCIDLNIQGNGAYSVLKQLATIALQNGFITDSHQFLQTLLLREKMHSTGFGSGVAVPHGKSACVKQPFVLFARKAQAIDWKASDGAYSVLKQLATIALQNGFITDSHQFLQTLLLREKMHSTGFGSGVAVPHGKSACVKQPFVLFARKAQAIDWKASDGEDVNCWICLGVPQSGEEDQVKIIGTLCRKIIHQEFIHQLQQGDTDQVLALLNQTLSS
ncbi:PTS fructose transporter subunit IIA [Shigella dysenteriae]|nr:PTS fructose transporter subunit IIA [Shigella dysenteriae]